MENLKNEKIENSRNSKSEIKEIKIDLSKIDSKLLIASKSNENSKSIYNASLYDAMNSEERKKFRSQIRRDLNRFRNDILGKDRSDSERSNSIMEFMGFYKKYWKIQDFKIENFSNSRNPIDIKDYSNLLNLIKSAIS